MGSVLSVAFITILLVLVALVTTDECHADDRACALRPGRSVRGLWLPVTAVTPFAEGHRWGTGNGDGRQRGATDRRRMTTSVEARPAVERPVNRARLRRRRRPNAPAWWRDALGAFTWVSMLVVTGLWVAGGGLQDLGALASGMTSLGRLTGLVASDLLLIQVLLMARDPDDRALLRAGRGRPAAPPGRLLRPSTSWSPTSC